MPWPFWQRIEEKGLVEAIDSGWLESEMDEFNVIFDEEMQSGARLVVGKNAFTTEGEAPPTGSRSARHRSTTTSDGSSSSATVATCVRSAQRSTVLYDAARQGGNPYPPMIDALIADATVSEVWGTLRQAFGHAYDAFGVVDSPFGISPA